MVNIPPEMEAAVLARAKQLKRPIANYLEWLVDRDLNPDKLAEDQAPYGEIEAGKKSSGGNKQKL